MVEGSIACHIKRSQSGGSAHPSYPPTLSLLAWFNNSSFFSLPSNHLFLSFSSSFLINCLHLDVNHKNPPPSFSSLSYGLSSTTLLFFFFSSLRSSHQLFPSNHTNFIFHILFNYRPLSLTASFRSA